jgi:hypothetical protein
MANQIEVDAPLEQIKGAMWDMIVTTNSSTSSPIISPDTIVGAFAADNINLQHRHYQFLRKFHIIAVQRESDS